MAPKDPRHDCPDPTAHHGRCPQIRGQPQLHPRDRHAADRHGLSRRRGAGRITASGKYKLATSGGSDGAQTASAVLLYAVDATLSDAVGIVVVRGPAIVSRAALAYDGTVDDGSKITTKISQLAALGIIARDTA